jgi:hypothetical protein
MWYKSKMKEEKGGKEKMGHREHIETLFLTHLLLLKKTFDKMVLTILWKTIKRCRNWLLVLFGITLGFG